MGFFGRFRKTDVAKDIYKRAYEEERIKQAAARGREDARKHGGKSLGARLLDNFAANAKGKGKSKWGLPTADTISRGFGSFDTGGGRRKGRKRNDDFGW